MSLKIETAQPVAGKPQALGPGSGPGDLTGKTYREVVRRQRGLVFKLAAACIVASGVGAGAVIGADYAYQIVAPDIVLAPRPASRPTGQRVAAINTREPQSGSAQERQSLYLVRSTLVALDQANRTGNYSVLRALGTPQFRSRNSSADLAVIFSGLRRNKIDLAEAAVVAPTWKHKTRVKDDGLQLRGVIGMRSRNVYFDMQFKPVAGKWHIFALSVSAKPLSVAAPGGATREPVRASRG